MRTSRKRNCTDLPHSCAELRFPFRVILQKAKTDVEPLSLSDFLRLAMGSLMELETQVLISEHLNYLELDSVKYVRCGSAELGRVLDGLISSLN